MVMLGLNNFVSDCCKAKVKVVAGMPDFIGDKRGEGVHTAWYECSKCGQPCSTVLNRKKRKAKKRMK